MGLIKRWSDAENRELAIWKIEETAAFFVQETGYDSEKKHPIKRLEHLAGRYVLHQLVPEISNKKIMIAEEGKPYFENSDTYFSISHSFPYIAVAVAINQSIGIDIQTKTSKIIRLQDKFLSASEQELCEQNLNYITVSWCAKEAVFKKFGKGSVDFKEHMPIIELNKNVHEDIYGSIQFKRVLPDIAEFFKGGIADEYCWAVTI